MSREIVARSGLTVVSVDYRLCVGGVHFPVPHDDVHAAFGWASGASGLLPAGAPWALGGASAGGNLAAGVGQRLRDEGVGVAALVLGYPVLHDPVPPGSPAHDERMAALPSVLRFSPESTSEINRNFLGENASDVAYAFPGLGEPAGLPRTLVVLCEYDDLRPSGERFVVEQLRAAGVSVDVDLVAGVPHGHLNIPGLPAALRSLAGIADFLTR